MLLKIFKFKYRYILRPILFKIDSEKVHEWLIDLGGFIGRKKFLKGFTKLYFGKKYKNLEKEILGIKFDSPFGLAAGFDYDGKIIGTTPALGFGFHTIGTVTNKPYAGNPSPRLGRLIKSKALLVNKGFKSAGVDAVLERLKKENFEIPVGISLGRSNLAEINTQELAINDILDAFKKVQDSGIPFSYYELNISCPNLKGGVDFYSSQNLTQLLESVGKLNVKVPLFVKMPIEKTNEQTLEMLNIMAQFPYIKGVIFGNLQKDRKHKTIIPAEMSKYEKGYASGLPTQKRSTELIKLVKQNFADRFTIIGCGGVFNAKDAQEKIDAGASLIQLITGLVYEGPQIIAQMNRTLAKKQKS